MKTLHLISQSVWPDALSLAIASEDAIVMFAEGTYLAAKGTHSELGETLACYVLEDDMLVRGLQNDPQLAEVIDYKKFVELTLKFDRSISW